jgi:hypothetical protein
MRSSHDHGSGECIKNPANLSIAENIVARRLWVLQEALLARDADFMCGSKAFSVHDLTELNLIEEQTYAVSLLLAHNQTWNHENMIRVVWPALILRKAELNEQLIKAS